MFLLRRCRPGFFAVLLAATPSLAPAQLQPLSAGAIADIRKVERVHAVEAKAQLRHQRSGHGLAQDDDFRLLAVHTDHFGQTHGHVEQLYKAVKLWGGMAILQVARFGLRLQPSSEALHPGILTEIDPIIGNAGAIAMAKLDPQSWDGLESTSEQVILPVTRRITAALLNAAGFTEEMINFRLARQVHTKLHNQIDGIIHHHFIVDAIDTPASIKTSGASQLLVRST